MIRLGFVPILLKVDLVASTFLSENVMTPPNRHLETEGLQERTQSVKGNAGIRSSRKNLVQEFFLFSHYFAIGKTFEVCSSIRSIALVMAAFTGSTVSRE